MPIAFFPEDNDSSRKTVGGNNNPIPKPFEPCSKVMDSGNIGFGFNQAKKVWFQTSNSIVYASNCSRA